MPLIAKTLRTFFDIYGIVFITDRNKKKEIADGYKKFAWFRSGEG